MAQSGHQPSLCHHTLCHRVAAEFCKKPGAHDDAGRALTALARGIIEQRDALGTLPSAREVGCVMHWRSLPIKGAISGEPDGLAGLSPQADKRTAEH
jgi:hypothetical protein